MAVETIPSNQTSPQISRDEVLRNESKAWVDRKSVDFAVAREIAPGHERLGNIAVGFVTEVKELIETGEIELPQYETVITEEVLYAAAAKLIDKNKPEVIDETTAVLKEKVGTLEIQLEEAESLISPDVNELIATIARLEVEAQVAQETLDLREREKVLLRDQVANRDIIIEKMRQEKGIFAATKIRIAQGRLALRETMPHGHKLA